MTARQGQMTAPPGDGGQLDFLRHVQRIFDEGRKSGSEPGCGSVEQFQQSPGGEDRGAAVLFQREQKVIVRVS